MNNHGAFNHDRDIHSVQDGIVAVLCAIKKQAELDKKYFDEGKPPPGQGGGYYTLNGSYRRARALDVDPLIEYDNSLAKELLELSKMMFDESEYQKVIENRNYIAYNYF